MKDINYEIIKEVDVIQEGPEETGWDTVVNIISWNGGQPKLDIRKWNKDRSKMGKGISLSSDACSLLRQILENDNFYKLFE
jgi:hypothetical protein